MSSHGLGRLGAVSLCNNRALLALIPAILSACTTFSCSSPNLLLYPLLGRFSEFINWGGRGAPSSYCGILGSAAEGGAALSLLYFWFEFWGCDLFGTRAVPLGSWKWPHMFLTGHVAVTKSQLWSSWARSGVAAALLLFPSLVFLPRLNSSLLCSTSSLPLGKD